MNPTARRSNRSIPRIRRIRLPNPTWSSYVGWNYTLSPTPHFPRDRAQAGISIAVGFFDPTETNELETLELETRAPWWLRSRRAERSRGTKSQVPSRRRNVTQRRDRFLPARCSHVSNMQMRVHNLSFARPRLEKV